MTNDDITPVLGPQDEDIDYLFSLVDGSVEQKTALKVIPEWVLRSDEFAKAKKNWRNKLTSALIAVNYGCKVAAEHIELLAAIDVIRNRVNAIESEARILRRLQHSMESLALEVKGVAA